MPRDRPAVPLAALSRRRSGSGLMNVGPQLPNDESLGYSRLSLRDSVLVPAKTLVLRPPVHVAYLGDMPFPAELVVLASKLRPKWA